MRVAVVVGVHLVVVACGSEASTPQQPVPTVAPTSVATTATVKATTNTSQPDDGCEGADQGVVCPPDIPPTEYLRNSGFVAFRMAAGTYETRLFRPRFQFTRDDVFESIGETREEVSLDGGPGIGLHILDTAFFGKDFDFPTIAEDECARTGSVSEGTLFGFPAQIVDVTTGNICGILFPGVREVAGTASGDQARLWLVDMGDAHLFVWAQEEERFFDRYFEETVQPTLDSVIFLDE